MTACTPPRSLYYDDLVSRDPDFVKVRPSITPRVSQPTPWVFILTHCIVCVRFARSVLLSEWRWRSECQKKENHAARACIH